MLKVDDCCGISEAITNGNPHQSYNNEKGAVAMIARVPIRIIQTVHLKVKRVKAKGRKVREKVQRHAIFVTSKVTSAQTVG